MPVYRIVYAQFKSVGYVYGINCSILMVVHFAIILLRWLLPAIDFVFLVSKIFYTANAKNKYKRLPPSKLGWYSTTQIDGTDSSRKRKYMQFSNYINIAIIVTFVVWIAFYLLPE